MSTKRRYPPLTPDDQLRFGKHKGRHVWEIIEQDPTWLRWAIDTIEGFELDNEAYKLLEEA